MKGDRGDRRRRGELRTGNMGIRGGRRRCGGENRVGEKQSLQIQ